LLKYEEDINTAEDKLSGILRQLETP